MGVARKKVATGTVGPVAATATFVTAVEAAVKAAAVTVAAVGR
jgi:hypothetical protein